jgi:protein tyrosine/serine phosphatase
LSTASPLAAETRNVNVPSAARITASQIRIDNFGQIDPNYYRGGQPEGRDYVDLASLGVKTVINLTSDDAQASERGLVEQAGMKYVQIPMTTHTAPTTAQLAEFLRLVNDPAAQPVYVHCVGGRHRTGVMTAVYRMTTDGWNADKAFAEMKNYKFGFDFLHSEFKSFVYAYHPAPTAQPAASVLAVQIDK